MSYRAQYLRHTALTLAAAIVTGVLFYALRILLYQRLDYEEYGLFYALMSVGVIVHAGLSLGFDPGLSPCVTRFREARDWAAVKRVTLGALALQAVSGIVILTAAWWFAGPLAIAITGSPGATAPLRILAVYVALVPLFKTLYTALLGMQYIGSRSLADLVRTGMCFAAAFVLLERGFGILAPAYAYVLSVFAGMVAGMLGPAVGERVWGRRRDRAYLAILRAPFRWDGALVRDVFHSGKYLSIAFAGLTVFLQVDTAMLAALGRDLEQVAAYQVAAPTVMILHTLVLAGSANFMPMSATLWERGERERLARGLAEIYETAATLILPAGVLAACFGDLIMETLFRRDILTAPQAFGILAPASVFLFTAHLNLHVLAGIGRSRAAAMAVAWALGVNGALNATLIPLFGIRGAAIATAVGLIMATALTGRAIRAELDIRLRLGALTAAAAGSVALLIGAMALRGGAWYEARPLFCAAMYSTAAYGLLLAGMEWAGLSRFRAMLGRP